MPSSNMMMDTEQPPTDSSGDTLPKFPPELEQIIFDIVARADRLAIAKLVRVARRVQEWYVVVHLNRLHYELTPPSVS